VDGEVGDLAGIAEVFEFDVAGGFGGGHGGVTRFHGHAAPVTCVDDGTPHDALFFSGSADARVLVWDARAAKAPLFVLEGHADAVVAGGAMSAAVVRLDGEGTIRVQSKYRFPNRAAFARYESETAPVLRADGVARFGDKGITFERSVGAVVWVSGST
jgi:hypothetical protein